jgi:hypothetical protein
MERLNGKRRRPDWLHSEGLLGRWTTTDNKTEVLNSRGNLIPGHPNEEREYCD